MPERKNDGILSLNVKKVTNLALSLENKSDIRYIVEMPLRSEVFVGLQEKRCYSKVSPF